MKQQEIPTYIINLSNRTDRRDHILQEFYDKVEFKIEVVPAIENEVGAIGLWETIRQIVMGIAGKHYEYILICEDDHQFIGSYSKQLLFKCIAEARDRQADILLGGVSSVHSLFKASSSLLWIEGYTGNQFVVVFKCFFQCILQSSFSKCDSADYRFSSLSSKQFLIYPFISTQREFGYSDVTSLNCETGRVERLFDETSSTIQYILDSNAFYRFNQHTEDLAQHNYANILIPTYVINLTEREDKLAHIKGQFKDRKEFDIIYVKSEVNEGDKAGLWSEIREAIQMGIENDDDVLIICEAGHVFSDCYSRDILIKNIFEAHRQGADILSGGTEITGGGFAHALPVGCNRFWINHFHSTQFLVIYKKIFQRILDVEFDNLVDVGNFLSGLTSNKMLIYPYISIQENFVYSDMTLVNRKKEGMVLWMLECASIRLLKIQEAYSRYGEGIAIEKLFGHTNPRNYLNDGAIEEQ